jgi:hypothetical protein
MNKILGLLVVLIAVSAAFAVDKYQAAATPLYGPNNITVLYLGNGTGKGIDSIPTATSNVFGPYSMCGAKNKGKFSSVITAAVPGALSSGDSVQILANVCSGSSILDTVSSSWTALDTMISAGSSSNSLDISAVVGTHIAFKLKNLNGVARTNILLKKVRVLLMSPQTDYVEVNK